MQRDIIGGSQKLIESDEWDAKLGSDLVRHVWIVGDDVEPQSLRLPRDRFADTPQSDDAERLAANAPDRHVGPVRPGGPHVAVLRGSTHGIDLRDQPPGQREEEHQGMVGHLVIAVARRIRHHNLAFGGRLDVNGVVARSVGADNLAVVE